MSNYPFLPIRIIAAILIAATTTVSVPAQESQRIHVVYMGGVDCPPCNFWRATEYPKLAATDVFKRIRYTHVEKTIRSSVPPKFFLPQDVKHLKDKLDHAANGMSGSPHTVLMVDGEVFDYKQGTYSASELEERVLAIESGKPYHFPRCVQRRTQGTCALMQ